MGEQFNAARNTIIPQLYPRPFTNNVRPGSSLPSTAGVATDPRVEPEDDEFCAREDGELYAPEDDELYDPEDDEFYDPEDDER